MLNTITIFRVFRSKFGEESTQQQMQTISERLTQNKPNVELPNPREREREKELIIGTVFNINEAKNREYIYWPYAVPLGSANIVHTHTHTPYIYLLSECLE